jgi:glycosyltransferase involved in cell wall biosynthesis
VDSVESKSVALCLLTWNELEGCKLDIPKIDLEKFDQVYAVDGGSDDGTIEYMEEQGIEVMKQPVSGYNQAYLYAFQQCKCDALVLFHPKGTVSIEDLYKFRGYFEQGYSLVVASRMLKESSNEEDTSLFRPRKWFVRIIALYSYILWAQFKDRILWDVLHGYRGMLVADFNKLSVLENGISVDIEMVSRSYKGGLKYIEFPTIEKRRNHGRTHFPALSSGLSILKYLLFEIRRKF